MKQDKINLLETIVTEQNVSELSKRTPLFGGAGIMVVTERPTSTKNDFYGEPTYVVTTHARELSWLIYQLKDIFSDDLDYFSKINFYGRVAEIANKSIIEHDDNLQALLSDVIEGIKKL